MTNGPPPVTGGTAAGRGGPVDGGRRRVTAGDTARFTAPLRFPFHSIRVCIFFCISLSLSLSLSRYFPSCFFTNHIPFLGDGGGEGETRWYDAEGSFRSVSGQFYIDFGAVTEMGPTTGSVSVCTFIGSNSGAVSEQFQSSFRGS